MQKRYLTHAVREDLQQKMVFLGGPRQVGKTTLARFLSEEYPSHLYLNWDNPQHKIQIIQQQWPPDTQCIVFDEILKYAKWKNHIKGIWDTRHNDEKICVTGSSRLDIYRRGGDSLLGHYHYFTLHPFSLKEWSGLLPSLTMPQKCHDLVLSRAAAALRNFLNSAGSRNLCLTGGNGHCCAGRMSVLNESSGKISGTWKRCARCHRLSCLGRCCQNV